MDPIWHDSYPADMPKTIDPASRRVDQQINALYGTHNTPTFLGFLYFDFGWGGLLIVPALYGALTALVYRRFRAGPRLFWLIVYIDFLLAVALAFRTHRFFGNNLLYFGLVALLVELVAGRRDAEERTAFEPAPALAAAAPDTLDFRSAR